MESDKLNLNVILLRISLIFDVVLFFGAFTGGLLAHEPPGTSLMDYYIEDLRTYFIFDSFKGLCIFALMFMLTATLFAGLPLLVGVYQEGEALTKTRAGFLMALVIALIFLFMGINRAFPAIVHRPVITTVTVTDKDERYGGSRHNRHWIYELYFSNGKKSSVPEPRYSAAQPGDVYYMVMCGSQPIGTYSAAEYTIPSSSSYRG